MKDESRDPYDIFDAWSTRGIDKIEALEDFHVLSLAIDACRKHFQNEQMPFVIQETERIAHDFIEVCLQKAGAKKTVTSIGEPIKKTNNKNGSS